MWGCISTEASYQLNFNTGFSTTKSDVLIHLAQWQYWWWFWFAFLWSFYYLVITKIVRYRTLKMRPKIVTSYRPHGKWGDFLAAIIPGIWCLNILTNSNFILRLIEWQNESSLFLIRIRARQWYWVYKFELKNFTDILIAPKNIGRNKWQLNTFGDLSSTDDYLHVLQMRSQNRWIKSYWDAVISRAGKVKQNHSLSPIELFRNHLYSNSSNLKKNTNLIEKLQISSNFNSNNIYFTNFFFKKSFFSSNLDLSENFFFSNTELKNEFFFKNMSLSNKNTIEFSNNFYYNFIFNNNKKNNFNINYYSDFIESSRYLKKSQGSLLPLRLIKLDLKWSESSEFDLFRFLFISGN